MRLLITLIRLLAFLLVVFHPPVSYGYFENITERIFSIRSNQLSNEFRLGRVLTKEPKLELICGYYVHQVD